MHIAELKNWLLDLLFPKTCVGCGSEGSYVCAACRVGLRFETPTCPLCAKRNGTGITCSACQKRAVIRWLIAPFSYRNELVRELIHSYKYAGLTELADTFAQAIVAHAAANGIRLAASALLVPIPLHPARERTRGFNQARLLANALARQFNLPVITALERVRATDSQIEMKSRRDRWANVAGAFRVRNRAAVAKKMIVLVDDVSTSGATLAAAAQALRAADARTVSAIVIAKG